MVTQGGSGKVPDLIFAPLAVIYDLTHLDNSDSFLWKWGLALAQMCDGSEFNLVNNWENRATAREASHVTDMHLRVIAKNYG